MKFFTNKDLREIPTRLWCGVISILFGFMLVFSEGGLKYAIICITIGFLLIFWWFASCCLSFAKAINESKSDKSNNENKD